MNDTAILNELISNYADKFLAWKRIAPGSNVIIYDQATETTGHKPEEFTDLLKLRNLVHADDQPDYLQFSEKYMLPEFNRVSARIRTRTDEYIPITIKCLLFSALTEPCELFIAMYNSGDEERQDAVTFKRLVESIHNIVFQTNNKGNWSYLNQSWERIMGYTVNDSIGQSYLKYLHPDDVEKNFKSYTDLITGKTNDASYEIRYIGQGGRVVWLQVNSIPLRDDSGEIIGTTGTLQDVSEDRLNRDMIELLSNNIEDLVCVHEVDGTYKYVSPSSKVTTGYLPEELIGRSPGSFFHPEDISQFNNTNLTLLDLEKNSELYTTMRFRLKSGTYKWFETSTKVIKDENGMPMGLVTSSRVIDQRKNAEEQLLKSLHKEQDLNQLKSNFVSLASHEFRTPLACIRTSVELLEISASKAKEPLAGMEKHIRNVFSEVDRMAILIDEVLTLGKIETEGLTCKKEKIKIVDIIREIIDKIGESQDDKRQAELVVEGKPRFVMADPMLFTHIISNLLSNALKYSPDKPAPFITVTFNKHNYQIKVRDYGIGIPSNEHNKIFVAFHRAANANSLPGTGLGMFITKNFVELHGGSISFESTINKGSEFTVTLD